MLTNFTHTQKISAASFKSSKDGKDGAIRMLESWGSLPYGTNGNNFPVIVGGGYRMDGATVMVLQKKGKDMTLKVLNTKGETLQELKL